MSDKTTTLHVDGNRVISEAKPPEGASTIGDWADPDLAYADTPTPPIGVAITVLPPDPDEQRE